MKKIIFFIGCLIFVSTACDKVEKPNISSNSPVFMANGTINGDPFSIVAGDDDAFMHTHSRQDRGVDVFGGTLSNDSFFVEMEIYNGNVDIPQNNPESVFAQQLSFVSSSTQPLVVLNKNTFSNTLLIEEVVWKINDSIVSTNIYQIFDPGFYDICGEFSFVDGTKKTLCETVLIGYRQNAKAIIEMVQNQDGILDGWLTPVNCNLTSIKWYLNNSLISELPSWSTAITQGFQTIEVQANFANGANKKMKAVFDGTNISRNIQSFSIFESDTSHQNFRDFSVRLRLHQNGTTYSSDFADNSSSSITINKVEYYQKNAQGNDTYKVEAEISAKVQENLGSSPKIINFTTTFGFEVQ